MFSGLWKRSLFMGIKKNARRDKRLKRPRVLPSLERLEARELLSTATPSYIIESTQQGSAAPASRGHPASPPASPPPVTYTPTQIENAYGFNQISFASYTGSNGLSLPGTGQTIAIVDAYNDPDIWSNLETFDAEYGLVNPNLTVVNQSGTVLSTNGTSTGARTPSNNSSWAVEESLDVEWAHAIAPGANIVLVEANSASTSSLMTAVKTASTYAGVSVVSMSWGENESSGETSYDSDFTTPGVTYVGASGDSGSPPIYPATSPNVLAVGGTSLYLNSSGGYGSETVWNSDGGSSGGGISQYEPLPSYQPGTYSNGSTTGTSTMRMSPDVAYDADPNTGFLVYDTDGESGWLAVGGTSDAAPQWAALIAIANQGRQAANNNTPNPLSGSESLSMLYQMGTGSSSSTYFHDITTGSNGTYSAGPGYDLVTGLGTPIANNVVNYLVNGSSTSPSPSAPSITQQPTSQSVTAGSNVTFTATASGNPTPTVQWYVNSGSGWSALSNGTN
ncbi:MAG TPA: immunoglobulin domain-containing protein, partial [Gemmataceae bacterium]|nr:immunoglobulin domain-containing protein [Gemmataceae bacterium]